MDEINEGVGDPFDTPVPGQSLTDTPGNYPWEHPPQYADPAEVAEFLVANITPRTILRTNYRYA